MFYRIFIITEGRVLDAYSGSNFNSPEDYGRWIRANDPGAVPFAWETQEYVKQWGDRARYERCAAAIDDGNLLRGWLPRTAKYVLKEAAIKMGVLMAEEDGDDAIPLPPPEEVKPSKPMLQIVQDFIEEIDAEELARRAHEATQAICKGTK